MLLVWKMPVTRPTRDIDLLGRVSNDLASIREVIASICQIPTKSDGMVFDSGTVTTERITEDADYEGSSRHFWAILGNTRLPMQIDIGFSDVITPKPAAIVYPTILGYPAPELHAYNRETVIAEKFEAMVKLGELNSRMKDFFDIWCCHELVRFAARSFPWPLSRRSPDVEPSWSQTRSASRRSSQRIPARPPNGGRSCAETQARTFQTPFQASSNPSLASSGPLLFAPLRSSLWIRFGALADRGQPWDFGDASCRICQAMASFLDQENASFGWYR